MRNFLSWRRLWILAKQTVEAKCCHKFNRLYAATPSKSKKPLQMALCGPLLDFLSPKHRVELVHAGHILSYRVTTSHITVRSLPNSMAIFTPTHIPYSNIFFLATAFGLQPGSLEFESDWNQVNSTTTAEIIQNNCNLQHHSLLNSDS